MKVFDSAYADNYDAMYAEKNYSKECDLVEQAVSKYGPSGAKQLLDVGCGTGGHAWEFAQRGYKVTGVDLSAAMLEVARSKTTELVEGDRPRFVQGDARTFDAEHQHDVAIMMFAVVGYLVDNAAVASGLGNIRRHLRKGGLFICDFWYGPAVLSVRPGDRVRVMNTPSGKIIRAASTVLDTQAHTADVSFQLWTMSGGKAVSETNETHRMRYFFPQEMRMFLELSGFELVSMSAFPSLNEPLDDKSWNAVVVARAV
jgi:SAM-dependent methyltransferase